LPSSQYAWTQGQVWDEPIVGALAAFIKQHDPLFGPPSPRDMPWRGESLGYSCTVKLISESGFCHIITRVYSVRCRPSSGAAFVRVERLFYAPRFERGSFGRRILVSRRQEEWWTRFLRVTYHAALSSALGGLFRKQGCPRPCPVLRRPPVIVSELGEPDPDTGVVEGQVTVELECAFFRRSPWESPRSQDPGMSISHQVDIKKPICQPAPKPGALTVCGYAESSERLSRAKMEKALLAAVLALGEARKDDARCDDPCMTKFGKPEQAGIPGFAPSPFGFAPDAGSSASLCRLWPVTCTLPRRRAASSVPPAGARVGRETPRGARALAWDPERWAPAGWSFTPARLGDRAWAPGWAIPSRLEAHVEASGAYVTDGAGRAHD